MDKVHPDDKALHLKMQLLPQIVDDAMSGYKTTQATGAIFDMIAEVRVFFLFSPYQSHLYSAWS